MDYLLEIQILAFFFFLWKQREEEETILVNYLRHIEISVYMLWKQIFLYISRKEERNRKKTVVDYLWQIPIPVSIYVLYWSYLRGLCVYLGIACLGLNSKGIWGFKWSPFIYFEIYLCMDYIFFFLPPLCSLSVWSFKFLVATNGIFS